MNMEFYIKKPNGRYEKFADQWEGFPADGWWFVGDGKRNLVVPIDTPRPLEKIRYQQHRSEVTERLVTRNRNTNNISMNQLAEQVLDILEEVINEGENKE